MILKRVDVDPASSFFVLNPAVAQYRKLAHVAEDVPKIVVIQSILDALKTAAQEGWFYLNPRNEEQFIAYCDDGRRAFWLVVAPGNQDGFPQSEKDFVCITCLGHRDRKFKAAIDEHRSRAVSTGGSDA